MAWPPSSAAEAHNVATKKKNQEVGPMKLKIRSFAVAAVAVVTALMMVSLGGGAASASSNHSRASATHGPWVIGYSGGYYGNASRVQIEAEVQAYAANPAIKPEIKKLIINNAGTSVAAQIAAVDAMIAEHVNAILIDSNSLTGLNPAIAAAHKAGIVVVADNDLVSSPYAYDVQTIGVQFGAGLMQGLVTSLHGKGNIVELRGIAGNATEEQEESGMSQVLEKNPGIHVLAYAYANWDDAQAQADMANLLSRYNDIAGVFTGGDMEQGAVRAYVASHTKFVPVSGTPENGFACMLKQYKSQGLTGSMTDGHLWESALALKVALALLSGKKEPKFIPISTISWDDSQSVARCDPSAPATMVLVVTSPQLGSAQLTIAEVKKYMG
jgi:ribose transport system substrate-binding protein